MAFGVGEAIGTAAGASLLGLPGAVAGYGAVKGAKAAGKWQKERFKPIKEAKELLAADVAALKTPGKLGLTKSEIGQQVSTAQQAAGAQAKASQAALARQALAGQGFQAGAFTEAQRGVQEEAQKAGVAASARAHEMSRRIQAQEAARIRGALDAQRERARQAAVNTSQKATGLVGGITSAIGHALGIGPLAGLGAAVGGSSGGDIAAAHDAAAPPE